MLYFYDRYSKSNFMTMSNPDIYVHTRQRKIIILFEIEVYSAESHLSTGEPHSD